MIEGDDEDGKSPGTGAMVDAESRAAEQDTATFGMADMKGDLKAGLRRRSTDTRDASETDSGIANTPAPAVPGDPLKAAYMIVGTSALFTALASALLLHLVGSPYFDPTTRWLAPIAGAGLFALFGVLLARSSAVRPR